MELLKYIKMLQNEIETKQNIKSKKINTLHVLLRI